jgi:hypothetical protein
LHHISNNDSVRIYMRCYKLILELHSMDWNALYCRAMHEVLWLILILKKHARGLPCNKLTITELCPSSSKSHTQLKYGLNLAICHDTLWSSEMFLSNSKTFNVWNATESCILHRTLKSILIVRHDQHFLAVRRVTEGIMGISSQRFIY